MNEILPTGLESLLQRPAFRVLGEPLQRQLLALWEPGMDTAAATMRMDWSALAQMGDALARLNAEEPVVLAALLVFARYHVVSDKQFGGITGDLAGWFLQKAELWMLAALCACQWGGLL